MVPFRIPAHRTPGAPTVLASLALLSLLVGGCASPSPAPSPPTDAATATPATPSKPPTPSTPPIPTKTPATAVAELTPAGISGVPFGTPLAEVEAWASGRLGAPDEVVDDDAAQTGGIPTRILRWQGLRLAFEAPAGASGDPRTFATWWLWPDEGVPAGVALTASLPLRPTFADLTALFPAGTLSREEPLTLFRLPDGVRYGGEDALRPAWVAAGVERPAE